jgi:hypothetical protein
MGSAFRSLADMNDPAKTAVAGASTSVMDYLPANIMPKGKPQGDYYAARLGPYDLWAIEYGYRPLPGSSAEAERGDLATIAARSGDPALAYATDEDTEPGDPDPFSNRFDFGSDPLEFARTRAELVAQLMPQIAERLTARQGDEPAPGYERVRQAFGVLLSAHGQAMAFAARVVGGVVTSRSHRGDADAKPPFAVVDAAKQREALDLLDKQMFAAEPFSFPPELVNQLVATRWSHWGSTEVDREDYPVHDVVLMWQDRVLGRLLDPRTLDRIHDSELKVAANQDAFTVAELLERLSRGVMAEVHAVGPGDYTVRKPAISSLRRGLQRTYVSRLCGLVLGTSASADAQAMAALQLRELSAAIKGLLGRGDVKLDDYSRGHLVDLDARITKALDASVVMPRP